MIYSLNSNVLSIVVFHNNVVKVFNDEPFSQVGVLNSAACIVNDETIFFAFSDKTARVVDECIFHVV